MEWLKNINEIWSSHGFEILLVSCVTVIVILALYRKITGKKGTWSKDRYYVIPPTFTSSKNMSGAASLSLNNTTPSRGSPKESKGEAECRRVLRELFGRPFDKDRPDFLRNPVTGGNFNLEIDCYDPISKIGVEYNGVQHYEYVPYFHKNKEAFLNQKYRDDMKRRMCKDEGVTLIEVPHTVPVSEIRIFLVKELRKNGKL